MKKLPLNKNNKTLITGLLFLINLIVSIATNEQCCKKFECFECDSRFEPRCGESFNLTRETGHTVECTEFCIKLKHFYNNDYHYLRTCSSTIKNIFIKKTQVCYTTMSKDDGNLCFCDDDLCNRAASLSSSFFQMDFLGKFKSEWSIIFFIIIFLTILKTVLI